MAVPHSQYTLIFEFFFNHSASNADRVESSKPTGMGLKCLLRREIPYAGDEISTGAR